MTAAALTSAGKGTLNAGLAMVKIPLIASRKNMNLPVCEQCNFFKDCLCYVDPGQPEPAKPDRPVCRFAKTGQKKTVARFQKPTIEEVDACIKEKGYEVDAVKFYNFYESKGWKVGKNTMKSWKACLATWQGDKKPTPNLCIIDKKPGFKFQYNFKNRKIWLCEECYEISKQINIGNWAKTDVVRLEKKILEARTDGLRF